MINARSIDEIRIEIVGASRAVLASGSQWIDFRDKALAADEIERDWRQRLRAFANDSEQHELAREAWEGDHGNGVLLYSYGDFFTAYYDDARVLWSEADDDLPMFEVNIRSDPPHRTCIHAMHLAAWVQHLAGMCMPVEIIDATIAFEAAQSGGEE